MKKILLSIAVLFCIVHSFGQRTCHTMENHDRLLQENQSFYMSLENIEQFTNQVISNGTVSMEKTVINIPVVFHILYNTSSQNISDAQIQSQLDILNKDFRKLNSDWTNTPSTFSGTVADCEINFCLASSSPTGAATTGIIRKSTTLSSFSDNDAMKFTSQGGSDAWNTGSYLNIWVCNLSGGLLGYAQFPGGPAATDGVVINYTAFGSGGTAQAPYNKGRTATHEIGHWLNLRHIWGDATCGNDLVSDTPVHNTSNGGCPSHPKANSCGTSAEMFMNYMDYTDDACMYMFTAGQKARMQALFVTGGSRASLKNSTGCSGSQPTTPQYCTSNSTNTQYEWISNVKIGTINNTSAANGGYGNFTSLSTDLTKGSAYTLSMTPTYAGTVYTEYFKVYIDYNGDADFTDAGELVYTSAGVTAATSVSITIPSTAITGTTRMRVIMKDGAISGPCEVYTYGEVEDYTINLKDATATCNQPSALSSSAITSSSATMNWQAITGALNYTLQYKKSGTSTWTSVTVTGTSYNATGLSSSTSYNWQVRTNCLSGSSAYTSGANFTTAAPAPVCSDVYESNNTKSAAKTIPVNTSITALIGTSTDIDWFKFTNTSTNKNIRISLTNLIADYDLRLYNSSGSLLYSSENGGSSSESIIYNNAPVATYYIRVVGYNGAFSSSACYSLIASISNTTFKLDMSNEGETIPKESIQESITAYPNPTIDGKITCAITNEFIGSVQMDVYDALGRLIESKTIDKSENFISTEIELGNNQKGIYYLKIFNENFQQTTKIVFAE